MTEAQALIAKVPRTVCDFEDCDLAAAGRRRRRAGSDIEAARHACGDNRSGTRTEALSLVSLAKNWYTGDRDDTQIPRPHTVYVSEQLHPPMRESPACHRLKSARRL